MVCHRRSRRFASSGLRYGFVAREVRRQRLPLGIQRCCGVDGLRSSDAHDEPPGVLHAFPLVEEPNTLVGQGYIDSSGAFDLEGLVPGKYVLYATTSAMIANLSTTGVNYILNNIF